MKSGGGSIGFLTGSCARNLRTRGRNLLGGSAGLLRMHPIVYPELGTGSPRRPWTDLLRWGGLPSVLDSETPKEDLQAYVGLYLQEEIRAEGLARSVPNFSRFLETAATMNGEILNYIKVGNDAQLSPRTVRDYFWRSLSRMEVDFVVAEGQKPVVAIEVKASRSVSPQDMKGLRAFSEDWPRVRKIVVSLEPHPRTTEDRIEILPVERFLSQLWAQTI